MPPPTIPYSMSAGNPYLFSVTGSSILKPVTLTLPISAPTGSRQADQDFAAYYDNTRGSWVPVNSQVDNGLSVLRVSTMHTSWWKVWTWDFSVLRARAKTAFRLLSQAVGVRAYPLHCAPMDPAATVTAPSVVGACFEGSSSKPGTLRIVDNRSYALLISAPNTLRRGQTQGKSLTDTARQWIVRQVAPTVSYLPAGEEMAFDIPTSDGSWTFQVRPSVVTFGIDVLVTVAQLVVPGFEQAKEVLDTLDCLQTGTQALRATHGTTELDPSLTTPLLNVVFDCIGRTPLANPLSAAISQVRTVALQVISLVEIVNDTRQSSDLVLERSPASS